MQRYRSIGRSRIGGSYSLNHLISPQEDRLRDNESECLGRVCIDDQLELVRLLNGQVSRLRSFKNLVDVCRCAAKQLREVGPVAYEATRRDKSRLHID